MTILVATTNDGKLRETLAILDGLAVEFRTLADYPDLPVAEESGASFAENARQKALHYWAASGLPTLAEDSGFEVDALGGAPGIYSARFGGPNATYEERFEEIYRRLAERKQPQSPARFVCALALVSGGRVLFETLGVVEGFVAPQPRGQAGFGYDPIFFYAPYSRTFGEVSADEKAAVSHRGRAVRALRTFLDTRAEA
jgi:non-canonical purine NTP pyrophosphatase (RdgB/HAM1 family)